jgi:SAM-dependent methyltransferase
MECRNYFDRISHGYDSHLSSSLALGEDIVLGELLSYWKTTFGTVWDGGCGTGLYVDLFPKIPVEKYKGVDISEGMLSMARRKHPLHNFCQEDILDVAEDDLGLYDCVISLYGSLSLMGDEMENGIESCFKRLRSGGQAILMFNGEREPKNRDGSIYSMESEDDLPTVRLCSAKELGQMVDPFGDGSIDITVFNKNADSVKSNGLSARAYAKIIGKESSESYKLNEVPDGEAAFYIVRKYA